MVTSNPPIVSRAGWGANPVNTPAAAITTPTAELWLHHTASSGLHGPGGMRSLQQNARNGGYVDLEYTLMVDNPDGTIYMSRGPGRDSAATGGRNSISHAICVMGNFENDTPSAACLDAIASCVQWLVAQRAIRTAAITGPHRDAPGNATACCGRNLIARIGDINRMAGGGSAPGPAPTPGGDDVPADKDFVAAFANSEGAWRMQYDGGVETIRGPFYGSYFTLDPKARNDPGRRFLTLCAAVDGGKGYTLVSTKGEPYTMNTRQ